MVDPDAPSPSDPNLREYLHWYPRSLVQQDIESALTTGTPGTDPLSLSPVFAQPRVSTLQQELRDFELRENQLRLSFTREWSWYLAAQGVLNAVVSSVAVFCAPVNDLLRGDFGFFLVVMCYTLLGISTVLGTLLIYRPKQPLRSVFFGLYLLLVSLIFGVGSAIAPGKIGLQAVIVTSLLSCARAGYGFWTSKDFIQGK